MTHIKRIFLSVLFIAIIVGIGAVLFKKAREHRISEMVRAGNVMIDQELHKWRVCKDSSPVKIELYVRNNSDYKINGYLVFLATLSRKGLEEEFLREFIECYGEERLKKEMKEEIAKKVSIGRLEAVYNYILRGKRLLQGKDYEPTKIVDKDYTFRFRKEIFMKPGEIIKIDHEQQISLNERGHLLGVKIETIEF